MIPEEREFPQFAQAVLRGLYIAVLSDVDVFLLALASVGLGSPKPIIRGTAKGLFVYVGLRRADQLAGLFASKFDRLSAVISDG